MYNKKKAIVFSNFEAMERFYDIEFFSKNFLALYLNLAILILLIFTIAGTAVSFSVDTSAFSYVIAIDGSGSMTTSDIFPTRLGAAKISAKNFIESLPIGVEIGIIGFSGDAEVLQVLDNSKIRAKMAIDSMGIGQIQGTNIYNALIAANKLFEGRNMKSIVLISDGQLNVGDAPQITRYANRNNLIVNTIAVGTEKGGLTELNTLSTVDEEFLKALAFNSGGKFFRATDVNELENSFSALIRETNEQVTIDITLYSLFAVVILFALTWIMHNLRFKVIP